MQPFSAKHALERMRDEQNAGKWAALATAVVVILVSILVAYVSTLHSMK